MDELRLQSSRNLRYTYRDATTSRTAVDFEAAHQKILEMLAKELG
jgi:hypothetical protein